MKGLQRVRAGIKVTVKEEPPAKAVASSEPGTATKIAAVGGMFPDDSTQLDSTFENR
ncbi:MAG: hypothetical protein U0798_21470 [Gemmataceae bacterium]